MIAMIADVFPVPGGPCRKHENAQPYTQPYKTLKPAIQNPKTCRVKLKTRNDHVLDILWQFFAGTSMKVLFLVNSALTRELQMLLTLRLVPVKTQTMFHVPKPSEKPCSQCYYIYKAIEQLYKNMWLWCD